jgi:3-phenylpropionate/cinnamic acid dioxygenase small subunit
MGGGDGMSGVTAIDACMEELARKDEVVTYLLKLARMLDDFEIKAAIEEFTADGSYKLIPRENHERGLPVCIIDDDRDRLIYRSKLIFEHWHYEKFKETRFLSNFLVGFPAKDTARAQSNFVIYRTTQEGVSSLHLVGTFDDKLVFRDGRWRIKDRLAILETFASDDAIVVMP